LLPSKSVAAFKKNNNKKVTSPNLSKVEGVEADNSIENVDNMLAAIQDDSMMDCDSPTGGGGVSDGEDEEDADDDPELLMELENK
jgi:hypothetical protein